MNALDTTLNYLSHKLELLQSEEAILRQKQVELGKEIADFFKFHELPVNTHPIQVIKFFRQKKVLETL